MDEVKGMIRSVRMLGFIDGFRAGAAAGGGGMMKDTIDYCPKCSKYYAVSRVVNTFEIRGNKLLTCVTCHDCNFFYKEVWLFQGFEIPEKQPEREERPSK